MASFGRHHRLIRTAPADERLLASWLSGWAIPDLATDGELAAWAGESGFKDWRIEDITPQVRPSLRRLFRMVVLAYPAAITLRTLRLRSATQHGNFVGARDQYRALRRGLWKYGMMTGTKTES